MLPCDICGKSGHSWFDCQKRSTMPTGWRPDRILYGGGRRGGKRAAIERATDAALDAGKTVAIFAHGEVEMRGSGVAKDITQAPIKDSALAEEPTLRPGRGRPKSIDDMKAYKAAKQREYRARRAAQKESK